MRTFIFAVCLAAGLGVAQAQHVASSPSWDPKAAAGYMDARQSWWMTWPNAARDHDTACVSCHTALPYALARPALRAPLAEREASAPERKMLEQVTKRVRLWKEVEPFYPDQTRGLPKTSESRGTEAILNAAVLSARDASLGTLSDDTRQAFENMWSLQFKAGEQAGGWAWLNFHNEPWEAPGSQYFGNSLAAIALGMAPGGYAALPANQDRVKALAPEHPEWATMEPFASLLKGDLKGALAGGEPAIFQIVTVTHSGMTTDEFEKIVSDWITTAKHPTTGRLYTEMVYQPMLELLAYLRASGFKTFIVSGGGIDFMRVFAERIYGIPPEQIVGSSGKLNFELRDGRPRLMKLPELNFNDDKAGKPVAIQMHIGRHPIAAFGNSDGDLQMLEWARQGTGVRFALIVHHTDAEREWAYDRKSAIGKLDRALDTAQAEGWTIVDMKNDWKRVFSFEGK